MGLTHRPRPQATRILIGTLPNLKRKDDGLSGFGQRQELANYDAVHDIGMQALLTDITPGLWATRSAQPPQPVLVNSLYVDHQI